MVLVPERAGVVEGAVAAGGWGLSLLPVHVVSAAGGGAGAPGASGALGTSGASGASGACGASGARGVGVTRASRRRRWGGGSGPS
nr:hypothetical protein [Streptomyces spiramyceticus]